ncbi:MAG: hypothetical protein ABIO84_03375 [Lysobacter sp.]
MGNNAGGMMKGDFTQLYSRLGLRQECTLAEFKRAYRLRIGGLHPDKRRGVTGAAADDELAELLRLYSTATRFHRRHGRLPGARTRRTPPVAEPVSPRASAPGARRSAVPSAVTRPTDPAEQPGAYASDPAGQRPVALALLLVIGVAVLAMAVDWSTGTPEPATAVAPLIAPESSETVMQPARAQRLELGMDPASVLAIQGKPVSVNGERWDYGPSWLRFANGQLVDWRSSPLHHLQTATPSPPPAVPDNPSQ